MKKLILLSITILFLNSCSTIQTFNPEITTQELKQSITFLASDSLKGRKPGTPEAQVAANFIADKFMKAGFKPLDKEIFQYFDVVTQVEAGKTNSIEFEGYKAELEKDFIPFNFSKDATASGDVVFCGFAFDIDTDSLKWNDFANVDVKDKWVLAFRADPELDNPDSKFLPYTKVQSKVLNAKDHGAIGVLLVSGVEFDKKDKLVKPALDQSMSNCGIPVFHINRALAN